MSVFGWILAAGLAGGGLVPVVRERMRAPMNDAARKRAPGRFAALSNGVTHYHWIGPVRGPVVVCVHGLTTPSFVWDGLAEELVVLGFRVLVYDLYGRGFSDRPSGPQTPEVFVQQLRDLLDDQGLLEDVTLIGYSMGGVIAAAFADREGHRLRRLVLLAGAGMGHARDRLTRWAVEWPFVGDWAFHLGFPPTFRRSVEAERDRPSSVEDIADLQLAELGYRGFVRSVLASLRGCLRHPIADVHRRLAASGLPVVAVWGRDDTVIPIENLGRLAQWNRTARQEVIEGAGHGLPYTHTAEVAEILRVEMH
jgi:pimeloyl-ACP methyl ester carboxylesterase